MESPRSAALIELVSRQGPSLDRLATATARFSISEPPLSAAIGAEIERLTYAWREEHQLPMEDPDFAIFGNFSAYVADRRGVAVLVERGEQCVGCALVLQRTPDEFEISKFCIDPSERGRGLGRELLAMCECEARLRGARSIYMETTSRLTAALNLYRQSGYQIDNDCASSYVLVDIALRKML